MDGQQKRWHAINGRSGIALLECLVYCAVLTMIVGLGSVYLVRLHAGYARQERLVDGAVTAIIAGRTLKRDIAALEVLDAYGGYSVEKGHLILKTGDDDAVIYLRDHPGLLHRLSYRGGIPGRVSVAVRGMDDISFRAVWAFIRDIAAAVEIADGYGGYSVEEGHLILKTGDDDAVIYRRGHGGLHRLSYRGGIPGHVSVVVRGARDFSFLGQSEGDVRFMVVNIRIGGRHDADAPGPTFTFKAVVNPETAADAVVGIGGYGGD